MGYFSYFSYFMRTFFNFKKAKKFIFILLIIILILFAINNHVFGWTGSYPIIDYVYNGNNIRFWGYEEEQGFLVTANSNGTPYQLWFCGGSDTASTWSFTSSTRSSINALSTSGRSYYRAYTWEENNNRWGANGTQFSYRGSFSSGSFVLYSSRNLYNSDGTLYLEGGRLNTRFVSYPSVSPSILTDSNNIVTFNFNNLEIDIGSYEFTSDGYYGLIITFNGTDFDYDYSVPISGYYDSSSGHFIIPKRELFSGLNIRTGNTIKFEINMRYDLNNYLFDLGSYTLNITSTQEENINADLQAQAIENLNNTQQETNNKIDNLNNTQQETNNKIDNLNNTQQETNNKIDNLENTITDSSINDVSMSDLPQDSTQDITAEGVNGIFTSIYNAFCTGTAQDIVFPIPFTNKNITLQANYVENNLRSSGASWVITIIQAFWWYLISRFIIKDVMDKINKIKGGNIENIETDNIKGDML